MARAPLRMATSGVTLRLQRTGASQPLDPDFEVKLAPLVAQFDDPITVQGQPRFSREGLLTPMTLGDAPMTAGYVTFAIATLAARGITDPKRLKNALIVEFERDYETGVIYQITEVRHRAHLTGGPMIVKAAFIRYKDQTGSG